MTQKDFSRTRRACYFSYLSMASVFVLPSMLFVTFHDLYGISYTLLGTLVLTNFCTQLIIDLIFTFFPKHFNIKLTVRIMPMLTSLGLLIYAIFPTLFPDIAYVGLVVGTVIFSVASGLSEVLLSPMIAAIPSPHPEKDMSLLHSLYGWGVVSVVLISSLYFLIFSTEKWTYLALFWAAVPLVASYLFFIAPIPENAVSSDTQKSGRGRGRVRMLALCVLCIFLGSAAENSMTNWISSFMENALMLPKAVGDMLGLAIFALLLAITRMLYAKFSPDISKTLLISMICAAVCYFVVGLSGNVIISFIACILIGMCTSMLWPGTLILMEERVALPGIAAYALMAASGDLGASVAPQLIGIVVDSVAASDLAASLSQSSGMSPDEIGLKVGMLTAALFPTVGILLVLYIMRSCSKNKEKM